MGNLGKATSFIDIEGDGDVMPKLVDMLTKVNVGPRVINTIGSQRVWCICCEIMKGRDLCAFSTSFGPFFVPGVSDIVLIGGG